MCIRDRICTGCQSTPEVVEKRMSGYGSNGQIKSDDINYCSLLELKNANLKDINVELDNMVLPEKIDFSQVESVEVLDMSFESGFTDNKEHIAGLFGVDADLLTDMCIRDSVITVCGSIIYKPRIFV